MCKRIFGYFLNTSILTTKNVFFAAIWFTAVWGKDKVVDDLIVCVVGYIVWGRSGEVPTDVKQVPRGITSACHCLEVLKGT